MMTDLGERIARLEEQVRDMRYDIAALADTLNGPTEKSVRGRLHLLENDRTAAKAAAAALAAAQAVEGQAFSRREKIAGLVLALAVAALQLTGFHL